MASGSRTSAKTVSGMSAAGAKRNVDSGSDAYYRSLCVGNAGRAPFCASRRTVPCILACLPGGSCVGNISEMSLAGIVLSRRLTKTRDVLRQKSYSAGAPIISLTDLSASHTAASATVPVDGCQARWIAAELAFLRFRQQRGRHLRITDANQQCPLFDAFPLPARQTASGRSRPERALESLLFRVAKVGRG